MRLQLTIKRPGSLLSRLLQTEITERQYGEIVLLLSHPDEYRLVKRPPIGFSSPTERNDNARS